MELLASSFPVVIFLGVIVLIAFEVFEKSLIVLLAAAMMIVLRVLSPEEAIDAIDFDTIILLLSMMLLVAIARRSGVFSWMNVRLVGLTKGNPLLIYLSFALLTAVLSAFLDNVTTILIVVPITIELFSDLGKNPKPLILAEIFMSNLGGTMTLIGDPPNIIIGGARGLTFNAFLFNLWIPAVASILFVIGVTVALHWKHLRPIARNGQKLFLNMLMLRHLQYLFVRMNIRRDFVLKAMGILLLTLLGFVLQSVIGVSPPVIALTGASLLALLTAKEAHIHDLLHEVEWTTLLFFSGLFVLVAGVEKTGLLEHISTWIAQATDSLPVILLLIIWVSGFVSMVFDNIPFVTVMIPVVSGIEAQFSGNPHVTLLWWALSLGVCIGGNGTMIGASANVVGCDLTRKHGLQITFMEYFKTAFPLTCGALLIASSYILIRATS